MNIIATQARPSTSSCMPTPFRPSQAKRPARGSWRLVPARGSDRSPPQSPAREPYLPLGCTCGISLNCGSGCNLGAFASPVQHPHELSPAAINATAAIVKIGIRFFIDLVVSRCRITFDPQEKSRLETNLAQRSQAGTQFVHLLASVFNRAGNRLRSGA